MKWTFNKVLSVLLIGVLGCSLYSKLSDPALMVDKASAAVVKVVVVKEEPVTDFSTLPIDPESIAPGSTITKEVTHLCAGYVADNYQHVVTAAHCLGGEGKIVSLIIVLRDGPTRYSASVILNKSLLDIALLKVPNLPKGTPYLQAKEDYEWPGRKEYAIGHPLGLLWSVSEGIVSGYANRPVAADSRIGILYMQVSSPINPGNSGGPIINDKGEVIGVCSFLATLSEEVPASGIGFAVPSVTINVATKGYLGHN